MESYIIFSGTIALIFGVLFGQSLSLECVTCEWRAGQVNDTIGCVSTPYKEPTELCEQSEGNVNHVCETVVIYKTVKDSHYLSRVSRRCQFEHGNCDNHCNPESGVNCYSCCNANNNCNSLPMSSVVLPPHLTYNVTNMAAPEVVISGSTATIQLFIFIVNFFVM